MAVHVAGAARYSSKSSRTRRRRLVALGIVVVLIVAAAAIYNMVSSRHNEPVAAHAPQVLSFTAKQTADVNLVAGAVGQYTAANGALPAYLSVASNGDLVLCGDVCNPTVYGVGGLNVYQASNIKLMSYSAELTPPNQNIMYLVPGAKCGSDGKAESPNPTPRSMVILYNSVSTTGATTSRCVVL